MLMFILFPRLWASSSVEGGLRVIPTRGRLVWKSEDATTKKQPGGVEHAGEPTPRAVACVGLLTPHARLQTSQNLELELIKTEMEQKANARESKREES
jgi:hypothetical protein